jgi:hypothetical protein
VTCGWRWLLQRHRIGPVIRKQHRSVDPLLRHAGPGGGTDEVHRDALEGYMHFAGTAVDGGSAQADAGIVGGVAPAVTGPESVKWPRGRPGERSEPDQRAVAGCGGDGVHRGRMWDQPTRRHRRITLPAGRSPEQSSFDHIALPEVSAIYAKTDVIASLPALGM